MVYMVRSASTVRARDIKLIEGDFCGGRLLLRFLAEPLRNFQWFWNGKFLDRLPIGQRQFHLLAPFDFLIRAFGGSVNFLYNG